MASEARLQSRCLQELKRKGVVHANIHGGGWSAKGFPDIVVCLNGQFVAFELKVGDNGLQPDQEIWRKRIEGAGGLYYLPYTFAAFTVALAEAERITSQRKIT